MLAPSILDRLVAAVGVAAQRLGVKFVVIAAQVPVTGELRLVASRDAQGSADAAMSALRGIVAEKFGFVDEDGETGWSA